LQRIVPCVRPGVEIADRIARTTPVVPFVVCVVASRHAMKRSRSKKARKGAKKKAKKAVARAHRGYAYHAAGSRPAAVLGSIPMAELTFLVEDAPEGGFTARAEGFSIFTEADSWADLSAQVHDAVRCHFDEGRAPATIRARYRDRELSL
jgi:hypothetical protein